MEVISVNIGNPVTIIHNGQEEKTGIYKFPVDDTIFLGETDVRNDHVIDRRYHGGTDKACYLYPAEHYSFWKNKYPKLDWQFGMFGENISTQGLLEEVLTIGSVIKIGSAVVQVSQPRQPCYKLGIRFKDAGIVKKFAKLPYPGIYVRVLEPGAVRKGDAIRLVSKGTGLTLAQVYSLLMNNANDPDWFQAALNDQYLAESAKRDLRKILKVGK